MAVEVPAYKEFLRSKNFKANSVKSIKDFTKIPTIDKDNYLRVYPRDMLTWNSSFGTGQWTVSTTSGSTGEPYYFPRQTEQDYQYSILAELYLRNNFKIDKRKTLYIVGYPMGAWIGGVFTYEALQMLAQRGNYNFTIITPGIHKREIISAIKQLSKDFDQTIIGAYAPFLKDILDDGVRAGIDWPSINPGFIFSAEAFSESFRDYINKITGNTGNYRSSLNHYGTVDLGTMAYETPISVLLRRRIFENNLQTNVFPEEYKQPTLAQYIPELFYFEEVELNLLCSAFSGIPLVRYDLKDYGGIVSYDELLTKLTKNSLNINQAIKKHKLEDTVWKIPFVYVYERKGFNVSYYASIIYPDAVRQGLLVAVLEKYITGKFSMSVDYNSKGRQILNIHVELKHQVKPSKTLAEKIQQLVHESMLERSSEYSEIFAVVGVKAKPNISLHSYEDEEFFKVGTKQRWVR